jgi:hypothetical protein
MVMTVTTDDPATGDEVAEKLDAELPGEVAIASASGPQRAGSGVFAQRGEAVA